MPSSVLGYGGTAVKATEKDTALTEEAPRGERPPKTSSCGQPRRVVSGSDARAPAAMKQSDRRRGPRRAAFSRVHLREEEPPALGTRPEGGSRRRAATAEAPRQAEAARQRRGPRPARQYHTVLHVVFRSNVQSGRGCREAGGPGHRGSGALGGV